MSLSGGVQLLSVNTATLCVLVKIRVNGNQDHRTKRFSRLNREPKTEREPKTKRRTSGVIFSRNSERFQDTPRSFFFRDIQDIGKMIVQPDSMADSQSP